MICKLNQFRTDVSLKRHADHSVNLRSLGGEAGWLVSCVNLAKQR